MLIMSVFRELSLSHSQLQSSSITMIVSEAMKYDPPRVAKFTPGYGARTRSDDGQVKSTV
jgi:hypothetical protein